MAASIPSTTLGRPPSTAGVRCLHGAGRATALRRRCSRSRGGERAAVTRVERLKQVRALGPTDLADDDVVRRWRNACRTKSRIVTPAVAEPRASNRKQFARCSHCSRQPAWPGTVLNPIARAPARNTGCRRDTLLCNHGSANSRGSEHWLNLVPTPSIRRTVHVRAHRRPRPRRAQPRLHTRWPFARPSESHRLSALASGVSQE